jgi:hypothetical protein
MILNIGLKGSIADDYVKSGFSNAHKFITYIKSRRRISRIRSGEYILFCYTSEQNQELPNAIPYDPSRCCN